MFKIEIPKKIKEIFKNQEITSIEVKENNDSFFIRKDILILETMSFLSKAEILNIPESWIKEFEPPLSKEEKSTEILSLFKKIEDEEVLVLIFSEKQRIFYKEKGYIFECMENKSVARPNLKERLDVLLQRDVLTDISVEIKNDILEPAYIYFYTLNNWKKIDNSSGRCGITSFLTNEELLKEKMIKSEYSFKQMELKSYKKVKNFKI